jgi:hypothetical protein
VAQPLDGDLERQSVAAATVDVAPDPSLLPRLRVPLVGLALALLLLSGFAELRRRPGA